MYACMHGGKSEQRKREFAMAIEVLARRVLGVVGGLGWFFR